VHGKRTVSVCALNTFVFPLIMVPSRASRHKAIQAQRQFLRAMDDRRRKMILLMILMGVVILSQHSSAMAMAKNTSLLRGQDWVHELLAGHPTRFYNAFGMRKLVFQQLLGAMHLAGLSPSKYLSMEEQLAILLHACRTASSIRTLEEHFQRSPDTISKYVSFPSHAQLSTST
jgi:hypothetical protein